MILVVAIVGALIARATNRRKSAEQARVGADEAPAPPLKAEIVRYTEGTTSIGARFFLVDVKNTGSVELAPTVIVSGFDANGTRVVETKGYSRRGALQPGAADTVLASINEKPAATLARVEVVVAPTAPFIKTRAVTVAEITEQPSYGSMHQLVGTVVNQTSQNIKNVQVIAVGRDASGKPVAFGETYPTCQRRVRQGPRWNMCSEGRRMEGLRDVEVTEEYLIHAEHGGRGSAREAPALLGGRQGAHRA